MQERFFESTPHDRAYCDLEAAAANIISTIARAQRENLKPFETTNGRLQEPAIIIGGGPSAKEKAEELRNRDGFKIVVGGGHLQTFNPANPSIGKRRCRSF